jgi:hypothetical protein
LDSRLSEREEAAVSEWLESGLALHAMRDHPQHCVPILAGGWGAQLTVPEIRRHWHSTWSNILEDPLAFSPKQEKGPDQDLLESHVWDLYGSENILQHDSYCCELYPGSIGFPTERKKEANNSFGSVGPEPLWEECPEVCRREGHENWTYC